MAGMICFVSFVEKVEKASACIYICLSILQIRRRQLNLHFAMALSLAVGFSRSGCHILKEPLKTSTSAFVAYVCSIVLNFTLAREVTLLTLFRK